MYKLTFSRLKKCKKNQIWFLSPIRGSGTVTLTFPKRKYSQLLTLVFGTMQLPQITTELVDNDNKVVCQIIEPGESQKTLTITQQIQLVQVWIDHYRVSNNSSYMIPITPKLNWFDQRHSAILIITTQYPYFGGSATASYRLIQQLRADGHSVAGVFVTRAIEKVDPEQIGGVFGINKEQLMTLRQHVIDYLGSVPTLIFGRNYLGPIYAKRLFPGSHRIFMVAGSAYVTYATETAMEILQQEPKVFRDPVVSLEKQAIQNSHQCVFNSTLTHDLFAHLYGVDGIVYRRPLKLKQKPINWSNRLYDMAFVASKLDRKIKNYALFKQLAQAFPEKKTLVVGIGEDSDFENLTQPEVVDLLKQTKLLLIPSRYDSNPNIAYEAASVG